MKLLERLVNLDGISGDEEDVRRFVVRECKKHLKDVWVDKMGNVIARKKGKRPSIMLMAHMDEVGLMVRYMVKKNRLSVSPIGSIDPAILLGQRVFIHSKKNSHKIAGIITTEDVLDGLDAPPKLKMDDLFVFTGLSKEELEKKGIGTGSYVSFSEGHYCKLGSDKIIGGKALDDRIGCYMLLECMRGLKTSHEVYFVFTVQEEVGLYGAKTSLFGIEPDYAIVVDVTPHNSTSQTIVLGNGPVLDLKDAEMIANKCLSDRVQEIAEKLKLPLQLEVSESGTTDATSVFVAKGGIPSAVLGVAVGNIHTSMSAANTDDIKVGIKILREFLMKPPKECWNRRV